MDSERDACRECVIVCADTAARSRLGWSSLWCGGRMNSVFEPVRLWPDRGVGSGVSSEIWPCDRARWWPFIADFNGRPPADPGWAGVVSAPPCDTPPWLIDRAWPRFINAISFIRPTAGVALFDKPVVRPSNLYVCSGCSSSCGCVGSVIFFDTAHSLATHRSNFLCIKNVSKQFLRFTVSIISWLEKFFAFQKNSQQLRRLTNTVALCWPCVYTVQCCVFVLWIVNGWPNFYVKTIHALFLEFPQFPL